MAESDWKTPAGLLMLKQKARNEIEINKCFSKLRKSFPLVKPALKKKVFDFTVSRSCYTRWNEKSYSWIVTWIQEPNFFFQFWNYMEKNGFVTATKLETTNFFLLLQTKILLQQPNVLLIELNILSL